MSKYGLSNDDFEIISSYLKDGYTFKDIENIVGYTENEILYVKNNMYSNGNNKVYTRGKFTLNTVNVFCKLLQKGHSPTQIYDLFQLWNKISRKDFNKFCQSLRRKEIYVDLLEYYNIPARSTIKYESNLLDKDYINPSTKTKNQGG